MTRPQAAPCLRQVCKNLHRTCRPPPPFTSHDIGLPHLMALSAIRIAGLTNNDRLRPLSYPTVHVILTRFANDSPDSLENVQMSVSFPRNGSRFQLTLPPTVDLGSTSLLPRAAHYPGRMQEGSTRRFNKFGTPKISAPLCVSQYLLKLRVRPDHKTIQQLGKASQKAVTGTEVCLTPASSFKSLLMFVRTGPCGLVL